MEKVKNVAKGVMNGAGKVGGAYVERSRQLYDYYNIDPRTGEHLGPKEILKNHKYFIASGTFKYSGLICLGGSFFSYLTGNDEYSDLESYLRVASFSFLGLNIFLSSVFYSRTNNLRELKDSFLESPGKTAKKLAGGFVDAQVVAPTYKAMLVGRLTETPRKNANKFGGHFTERVIDPNCLNALNFIGKAGKIGRGLENLMIKGSEVFYGLYH